MRLYRYSESPEKLHLAQSVEQLHPRLIIQQISFGPSRPYERPLPKAAEPTPVNHTAPARPAQTPLQSPTDNKAPRLRSRRMSSSFSRVSYNVHDHADDIEVKGVLGGKGKGDGVLYGVAAEKQISSRWWM